MPRTTNTEVRVLVDSIAKYGIGESIGRAGEVLEDDYGISVKAESFVDIVTGVDPSKYAGGSGRIGDEALRRGLGFGSDGRPVIASNGSKGALRGGQQQQVKMRRSRQPLSRIRQQGRSRMNWLLA